jgi:hypothetical protein
VTALPHPFNTGRPWTPEEIETLRRLATEGVPPDLIAERLGRSRRSLEDRARRIKVTIEKDRADRAAKRAQPQPAGSATRTDKPTVGWTAGDASALRLYVLVRRGGQPPMPWTWAIHREGGQELLRRAVRGYRSAEEAWEAGRAALAALERAGQG